MRYMLLAALATFILFVLAVQRNPARMRVGFFFCMFLLFCGISYAGFVLRVNNPYLNFSLVLIAVLLAATFTFGLYVLCALLLINARQMHNRGHHSLPNRITLFLALALIAVLVLGWVMANFDMPQWVQSLWGGLVVVMLFYFFHIFVFLTSALLCNVVHPRHNKDYIVVLGAQVVDGKVSSLLARRVDTAVRFYKKQAAKRTPPKLVMSGGKHAGQTVSEAEAMRNYALECGVPAEDILLEEAALNTYQNMEFSKKLMQDDWKCRTGSEWGWRASFATSNYHLLRSGMLAEKVGLIMVGMGGRTALYYLPTAMLREYVSYFRLRIKPLLVIAALLFVAGAAAVALSFGVYFKF